MPSSILDDPSHNSKVEREGKKAKGNSRGRHNIMMEAGSLSEEIRVRYNDPPSR
jgi:hypothetical protein